jgi:hypothetical protein
MFSSEVMHYVFLIAYVSTAINILMLFANSALLRKLLKLRGELKSLLEEATRCNRQSRHQLAVMQFAADYYGTPEEMLRAMQENKIRH